MKVIIRSYVVKQTDAKRCDLAPNHTHFLIFDGESTNNDAVLLQRARIEQYSRSITMDMSVVDTLIPTVMVSG